MLLLVSSSMTDTQQDGIEKLGEMIRDIRVAMFTTIHDDGTLRSRPMAVQNDSFDGELWFFTGAHSPKMEEILHDSHVNVSFTDTDDNRFISISGKGELIRDRKKMEALWTPWLKAWFPMGIDDPELSLIKVEVAGAEYWDAPSRAMVHLIGLAKAVLTGKPLKDIGEHQKVDVANKKIAS